MCVFVCLCVCVSVYHLFYVGESFMGAKTKSNEEKLEWTFLVGGRTIRLVLWPVG